MHALSMGVDVLPEISDEFGEIPVTEVANRLTAFFRSNLPSIGTAVLIFLAGYILIRTLLRFLRNILERTRTDGSQHSFILSSIKIILYVILIIICVNEVIAVNLTPVIATLGALGLAISLALQDILGNIAGGISILFSRPFAKGDFVEVGEQMGTITEIGMIYTRLMTIDNKTVHMPNGDVARATIVNYSAQPARRLDLVFNIRDNGRYEEARQMMFRVIAENPLALADPAPIIRYTDQTYSHLKVTVMVWAETANILELKSQLIAAIRLAMREQDFT